MTKIGIGLLCLLLIAAGLALLSSRVMNAHTIRELREKPEGDQARKVMLITLPSGKMIPVNYLRDGETVYAGADFPWWRELRGEGGAVTVLIRGETLRGRGRAVENDPELRASVFKRLRPKPPSWLGTLVVVALD